MKKFLIILSLFPAMVINAQVIDRNNFDEMIMNDVLFNRMNKYCESEFFYPLIRSALGKERIYRFIRGKNEELLLDDLDTKINEKILRKYDSKISVSTNQVGCVGLLDSISVHDVKTYQDIAVRFITDLTNSVEGLIFLKWSQVGEAVTYYNKKTETVYLFFAFLQ